MLKLSVRAGSNEALYLTDKETGEPIAKIQLLENRGNQVSVGITALKKTGILRNKLVDSEKQIQYDRFLTGST